ncbi:MAG: hypothetical protein QMD46_02230 [Methanomicrobiales archaeon]|nr:hypothetical protein [Methanomicrobiales archaeon]MDI6875257.1 hypothetical protein [Methanomicrobiales archaeon]
MAKIFEIATRSFGADAEEPGISALSRWISGRKQGPGDIITYRIETSLRLQARITTPCAGGRFYADRLLECIGGIEDGKLRGEPEIREEDALMDAGTILTLCKRAWLAIPGPGMLPIADEYFHDSEEFQEGMARAYGDLMRTMRDAGIAGHVILTDDPGEIELELLSAPRVLFFHPEPNRRLLASLLEHQRQIAIVPSLLDEALDLAAEYTIQQLVLLDPQQEDISRAAEVMDIDRIRVGGYCREDCGRYWDDLASRAYLIR